MELRHAPRGNFTQDQLKHIHRLIEVQHAGQLRVKSPQKTNQATITFNTRRLPRMQSSMLARHKTETTRSTSTGKQRLDIGFYVIKIDVIATMRPPLRQTTAADYPRQHWLLLQPLQLTDKAQTAFE